MSMVLQDIVDTAAKLAPQLAGRAAATERSRCLATETFEDVRQAGLLKIFMPARYGGYEMDWGPQIQAGRELAKACPSTGWIVSVVGSHAAYLGRLSMAAQEDVWGSREEVLVATGSVAIKPDVRQADGGYVLNGQWCFCSGIDHATWVMASGTVKETGAMGFFLMPRSDVSIKDDWHVAGMSGTGSKSMLLDDVFVPSHRLTPFEDFFAARPKGPDVNEGSVYRADFHMFAGSAMLGPILGAAEGALQLICDLARDGDSRLNRNDTAVQLLVAESAAEIGTAACLLERLLERQNYYANRDLAPTAEHRVAMLSDRTFMTRLCTRAIERLVNELDIDNLLAEHPIQRQFRDLSAMAQQVGVNWDRNMSSCGQKLLGLASNEAFLNVD
jgi:3-hydroxy-9,10-secoandrosta-1,3,5(10)-triene-9,17-dione monooxygenase